jgi:TLC ATP/ADP transporter
MTLVPQGFHSGVAGTSCLRARQPAVKRVAPVAATASSSAAVAQDPDEKPGFLGIANITWKKIVPLGFMFFAILFNYTILRDTKVWGCGILYGSHLAHYRMPSTAVAS